MSAKVAVHTVVVCSECGVGNYWATERGESPWTCIVCRHGIDAYDIAPNLEPGERIDHHDGILTVSRVVDGLGVWGLR